MSSKRGYKRRSRPCLGVDVGTTHVKLLELDGKPGSMRAVSYASEPLPANAVSDHQIINADAVGQALARAVNKSGSRNKDAAIGVAGAAVISKTLTMPADMEDDEIEQQIMFEAPQHIPYPIENVNLDFQVMGPEPDTPSRNRVLLVACRRDNIEMRTAVLEVAKLKPRLVSVEEYALRNACTLLYEQMPNKGHDKTIAIFEIGAQQTRLNVQHNRHTTYSQEIPFGCHELHGALVEQCGAGDAQQFDALLRDGQIRATDIDTPLQAFGSDAAQQFESTLQYYFSAQAESDNIDQILLTGDCTRYPGLEQHMQDHLFWPLTCADPLRHVGNSGNARRNHVEHDGPALMVAAGLSMCPAM